MFVWRIECEVEGVRTIVFAVTHREKTRLEPFKSVAEAYPGKVCTRVLSAHRVGRIPPAWNAADPWYEQMTVADKSAA
jgi:hypothetical protein